MKVFFVLLSFLCIQSNGYSQSDWEIRSFRKTIGENGFQIKGPKAAIFVDALFDLYPKTKRKGYMHTFKKVVIPSITGELNLKINEGIHGHKDNGMGYFNTFVSEKYHKERIERMDATEEFGIIIYVEKRRRTPIISTEETTAFLAFLEQLSRNTKD